MFPIAPYVLHRVEFRRVGRQVLKRDAAALASDKLSDYPTAMNLRAIPHHQELALQMAQQMAKEVHHFERTHGPRVKPEVEVVPGDASRGRKRFPVEVVLQHRRLSARRPSSHPMGPLAQSALVDKDQQGTTPAEHRCRRRKRPGRPCPLPGSTVAACRSRAPTCDRGW